MGTPLAFCIQVDERISGGKKKTTTTMGHLSFLLRCDNARASLLAGRRALLPSVGCRETRQTTNRLHFNLFTFNLFPFSVHAYD